MDPRIIYSIQSAILFLIIASPQVYKITGQLFKVRGSSSLVLHSVVYGLAVYLLMFFQS